MSRTPRPQNGIGWLRQNARPPQNGGAERHRPPEREARTGGGRTPEQNGRTLEWSRTLAEREQSGSRAGSSREPCPEILAGRVVPWTEIPPSTTLNMRDPRAAPVSQVSSQKERETL